MRPAATAPLPALARRWAVLSVGITFLVTGVAASINAGIGVASWQVFETGLAAVTGAPLGWVLLVESVAVLLLAWLALGIRPGPATVLLALAGGPAIDLLTDLIPHPTGFGPALAMLVVSSTMIGVGIGLYVPAELGPSAQDSLFVGLYRRLGIRPGVAKFTTDVVLVVAGWLLGGQVGVGTVVVTVLIPPLIELVMPWGHRLAGTVGPDVAEGVEGVVGPGTRRTPSRPTRGR
ncbi:YczE/YyaS/YitT family protein [Salsipaludibacter albus]|uniref:YczE/YyaS/YitT family protein n=1 Tax=Salsipaludibacter albus TaxID=2849650 RepID=UPI001EE4C9D6|nr:hypothetical protein [Salsipaludibacter albus]MBY5162686.1 hypothetical protein [Salsipaludibacter albus]